MWKSRECIVFINMACLLRALWNVIYLRSAYPARKCCSTNDHKNSNKHSNFMKAFYLIGFFITCNHADSFNERMARIVYPGLDALVQAVAIGSQLVPQLSINGWGETLSHAVVVLAKIWIVCTEEKKHPKQLTL